MAVLLAFLRFAVAAFLLVAEMIGVPSFVNALHMALVVQNFVLADFLNVLAVFRFALAQIDDVLEIVVLLIANAALAAVSVKDCSYYH